MTPNETLIHNFYAAFQKKDYRAMQEAYHPQAEFSDPVFSQLSSQEVKSMWQMLLTSATDLTLTFENVSANDTTGKCHWEAWYTFTATGRKVHNVIDAVFEFRDGKIYRHRDHFNFWRWSRMALGTPGILLGWTPVIKNKVRQTARRRLEKFTTGK
jgi:ketosteroid isomerase-like protein